MGNIKQELDRIRDRISDPSFLANKGLSNEVGIHVFVTIRLMRSLSEILSLG